MSIWTLPKFHLAIPIFFLGPNFLRANFAWAYKISDQHETSTVFLEGKSWPYILTSKTLIVIFNGRRN